MNIPQIKGYYSRLLINYFKNHLRSVIHPLLIILLWQIHLLISLLTRLIKFTLNLFRGISSWGPLGPFRPIPLTCPVEFNNFREVSQEEVKVFACKPSSKSCVLDPLPAMVLKGCFSVLLPTITKFVNLSLSTGRMPNALKVAALSPSLKKPDADFKQFSNFRPISNLTLISKIIEKAVAEQLTDHVKTYHLDVMYQSAFKVLHSRLRRPY